MQCRVPIGGASKLREARQGPSSVRVQSDDCSTPAKDERFASRAGVGGLHILAYAMIAWAELTPDFFLLSSAHQQFFGQPEVERHERREARFIVLVVVFCSLYTALPLWWKILKSVLFYYFPRVLLYTNHSSLSSSQACSNSKIAVRSFGRSRSVLLACLLGGRCSFPLFELCCPPSPPPPLAIFPGTTFAHPHGRELLEVGRADRPLLFCLCPKCLSCAIGIAVCVTLSI